MAVIRLEFEVDSDVYPELHAALASIGNSASRGERFRQLAATGLVWETVRIHGASLSGITGMSNAPKPKPPSALGNGAGAGTKSGGRWAESPQSKPSGRSDFVDLAIDAISAAAPHISDPPSRTHDRDLDAPAWHIPVLFDVVKPRPTSPPSAPAATKQQARQAEAVTPVVQAMEALPRRAAVPVLADKVAGSLDMPTDHAGGMAPLALMHKPVTRSRLLRMKEKGLFKNG